MIRDDAPQEISVQIVAEIRELHSAILLHARQSVGNAIRIGEILAQIKAVLRHGEWKPWVKENCPFAYVTAHRYISCYDRRDQIKSNNLIFLTEAYALIASDNGSKSRPSQRLHESNFFTDSIRISQKLAGQINHEIKDRPIETWDRESWVSLAAMLEPLAKIYRQLKLLIG